MLRFLRRLTSRLDTPQRLCFAAAALVWCASALAWALQHTGLVVPVAPARAWTFAAHALTFGLGPMPLFITGFLFTAGPRWLRAPAWPVHALAAPVLLVGAGWLVAIVLGPWSARALALGLAGATLGWLGLMRELTRLRSRGGGERRSLHLDLAIAGCGTLTACLAVATASTAAGDPEGARGAALAGLWSGVVAVFVVASHRLLPFLGGGLSAPFERRWPNAELWLMWSAAVATGPAAALAWGQHGGIAGALRGLHAAVIAAVSASWWLRAMQLPARRQPLVAMLWRAWGWWCLAWLGFAAAQGPSLDGVTRSALTTAALHALTLGYLGGTMLAMVTRISVTLVGRSIAIDGPARALEAVLQGAVLARLVAAAWPSAAAPALALAAVAWAALAVAWTVRHGPAWLARRGPSGP